LPAEHAAAMGVIGASDIPRWRWQDMPIFFRAVHWASPHPCLTAYGLTESPNHVLIGLFRAPKWVPYGDMPLAPRVPRLCAPRPRRPPTGACCSRDPPGDRQPTPSHGMMAAKIDDED